MTNLILKVWNDFFFGFEVSLNQRWKVFQWATTPPQFNVQDNKNNSTWTEKKKGTKRPTENMIKTK